jgi:hypothetical protein
MSVTTNEDVVLSALFSLGGDLDALHIEDIAVTADELAPGRFRWEKYAEHINIQTIYKALKDARAHGLVRGNSSRGWMLSDAGLEVARTRSSTLKANFKPRISRQDRTWAAIERKRLTTEAAYVKFTGGDGVNITPREALKFFMLDEYVTGELRKARINRMVRLFDQDELLSDAVRHIAQKVPQ